MDAKMVIAFFPTVIARFGVDVSSIDNPLASTSFKMDRKSGLLFFLFFFIQLLSRPSMAVSVDFICMIADTGWVPHKYD